MYAQAEITGVCDCVAMQELMKLTIVKREDAKHKLGNWMIGQDVQLCAMI